MTVKNGDVLLAELDKETETIKFKLKEGLKEQETSQA
jgi:hypothetical protein